MSPITEREQVTICASCGTAHHRECWEENRGCCVRSCPEVSRILSIDVPREASGKLVLTREAVESVRPRAPARNSNPCMRCGKQVRDGELYCIECQPAPPESQDARNLWPILVILGLLAVLLAWVVVVGISSERSAPDSKEPAATENINR